MNRADRNRQMLEFFAQRAADYDAVHLPMMDNKRAITQALLGSPMHSGSGCRYGVRVNPAF